MNQSRVIDNDPGRPRLKHVQKTRQRLETTAGQNQQGLNDEGSSDSGDSLFLTQAPAADPVRPARRRRSCLNYSRFLEESEVESSSSSSQEEPRIPKSSTRLKRTLPNFVFSFLSGSGVLPSQKNRILHHFATRSFFKCLSEFGTETCLRTVDTDEEDISPLSEEEEEESHAEAFRVVNKRCFATELTVRRRNADLIRERTSGEKGLKLQEETAVGASASTKAQLRRQAGSSRDAAPSSSVLSKNVKKATQTAALKVQKCGSQEACSDEDGDVCEAPTADGDPESRDQGGRGGTADTRGSQTPPHSDDERVCISKRGVKRKRRKKKGQAHASVERQGQEQPEDPGVPESETLEPQATDDAEHMEMSLCDDQRGGQEERSTRKKRRKEKKNKTAKIATEECLESDSVMSQDADGKKKNDDDDDDISRAEESSIGTFSGAERVKVKRKKNKRISTAGEREGPHGTTGQPGVSGKSPRKGWTLETEDELSYPREAGEVTDVHLYDTAATLKGKSHKKKKEKPAWDGEEAEPVEKKRRKIKTDTSEDGLAQSRKEKRRASSFLCADAVEKDVQTPGGRVPVPGEGSDTQSAENAGSLEQSDRRVKKKKRKKKRNCEDAADGGAKGSEDGQRTVGGAAVPKKKGSRCAPEVSPPGRAFGREAEASSSGCAVRKKHQKSKRILYNPAGDFLE